MSQTKAIEQKTSESKELATSAPRGVMAVDEEKAWGAGLNFTVEDMKLSEICIMQGLSELVKQRKAQIGEWRDNDNGELLGDEKNGPEIMVLSKRMILFTSINKKPQRPEIYSEVKHRDLKMYEKTPQGEVRRKIAYEYTVLVADKRCAERIPYVLLFQSTQFKTGQRMATMFRNMARQGLPSPAKVLKLKCYEEKNDQGSWLAKDFEISRDATKEELAVAREWYEVVKSGAHLVNYAQQEDEPASAPNQAPAYESAPPPTDSDRLQF